MEKIISLDESDKEIIFDKECLNSLKIASMSIASGSAKEAKEALLESNRKFE